jgi:nucleotidyltransferase substrate binding protein (TIGR01987 family)
MPSEFERQSRLMGRARLVLDDFARAVRSLGSALDQPADEFVRDAAIQRFEFSFELAWKSIQAMSRLEGNAALSPRTAIGTAWRNDWITDEAAWLDMLDDRNRTSHTYHAATAEEVFANLKAYVPLFDDRQRHRTWQSGFRPEPRSPPPAP